MTKRKSKPEIMWMIKGNSGLYFSSNADTKREAISNHVSKCWPYDWKGRYALGDRAVKVEIREIK